MSQDEINMVFHKKIQFQLSVSLFLMWVWKPWCHWYWHGMFVILWHIENRPGQKVTSCSKLIIECIFPQTAEQIITEKIVPVYCCTIFLSHNVPVAWWVCITWLWSRHQQFHPTFFVKKLLQLWQNMGISWSDYMMFCVSVCNDLFFFNYFYINTRRVVHM